MPARKQPKPKKNSTKTLNNKQVDEYIDGIYDGTYTIENLPEFVYKSIVDYLRKGLYEGFGKTYNKLLEESATDEGTYGRDLELLSKLRENIYMFGAAKDYQMTKEISSLLFDDNGKLRTSPEFNEIARDTYDKWNDDWGETEYSTAIGQGYAAEQWDEMEKKKDILPNLRYSAISDPCEICGPLDGIVAPMNDPVWDKISPLNHFNCKCILLQEDEGAELTDEGDKNKLYNDAVKKMSPVFQSNPGKDGMVFNENHPYFDVAKEDRGLAKNNFGLKIPEKD